MSNNILTFVRVRPFNNKEISNKATNVISMKGNETIIQFKDKLNKFAFDDCFWSHDGFVTNKFGYTEAANPKYTDQKRLFEKLGKPLLDNAWEGYNCSLFAYGQTGSGKTYSIMGYNENKGLVPMICESLFATISEKGPTLKEGEKYQVTMGMVEIYNEKLRDLLASKNAENLTIRETPGLGFHAPNQLMVPVTSYEIILQKIELGNKQRSIASTMMNETSSRAHTIVSLQFIQVLIDDNKKMTRKTSIINLIDLAGSEQIKKSLAEGARLTEAQNINKSLHTLGICLNNLATKQSHVPYRDSTLTKLLSNALGGNSKTALIAAISPADINYEESLSTLRFTERVKKVSTNAKVNITENEMALKKLAEENQNLLKKLKDLESKKNTTADSTEIEELRNQIARNKADAKLAEMSWKEQVQQKIDEIEKLKQAELKQKEKLKTMPHILNLNDDPALNKLISYVFEKPLTIIGNSKAHRVKSGKVNVDIDLNGLNILDQHAEIRHDDNEKKTFIKPIGNANILINGVKLTNEYELKHYDRILLGNSLYFYHYDPLQKITDDKILNEPTIEEARKEVTEKREEYKNLDNKKLSEELSTAHQLISEANTMAEGLKKKVIYSLVIFNGNLPGYNNSSEAQVVVRALLTTKMWEYFLDVSDFTDMRYGMLDMFHDTSDASTKEQVTRDPFIPPETEVCCAGFTHVLLAPIKHLLDFSEEFPIINYMAKNLGSIKFTCVPCDSSWKAIDFSEKIIQKGTALYLKLSVDQIQLDKTMFKKIDVNAIILFQCCGTLF